MKRDSFRVLFFLKKTRLLKNGEASVCMRITVNGTRVENNIRKSIDPALWSQAKETARGKSRRACDLNTYIEEARIKLYQIFANWSSRTAPSRLICCRSSSSGRSSRKRSARCWGPCRSTTTSAGRWSARTMR